MMKTKMKIITFVVVLSFAVRFALLLGKKNG